MSKQTNGLQSMTAQVGDSPLGGCVEVVAVTEFSTVVFAGSILGHECIRPGSGISRLDKQLTQL